MYKKDFDKVLERAEEKEKASNLMVRFQAFCKSLDLLGIRTGGLFDPDTNLSAMRKLAVIMRKIEDGGGEYVDADTGHARAYRRTPLGSEDERVGEGVFFEATIGEGALEEMATRVSQELVPQVYDMGPPRTTPCKEHSMHTCQRCGTKFSLMTDGIPKCPQCLTTWMEGSRDEPKR